MQLMFVCENYLFFLKCLVFLEIYMCKWIMALVQYVRFVLLIGSFLRVLWTLFNNDSSKIRKYFIVTSCPRMLASFQDEGLGLPKGFEGYFVPSYSLLKIFGTVREKFYHLWLSTDCHLSLFRLIHSIRPITTCPIFHQADKCLGSNHWAQLDLGTFFVKMASSRLLLWQPAMVCILERILHFTYKSQIF